MVRKESEFRTEIREHARGGEGKVIFRHLLESHEYANKGRLMGKIILEPGSSIGTHTHENEMEIYYFLRGVASVVDNGEPCKLYPGEVLLTQSGQSHSIRNDGEENLEYIAMILYT